MAASIRIELSNGIIVQAPDHENGRWYYMSITRPMPYPEEEQVIYLNPDALVELNQAISVIMAGAPVVEERR